jgi:mono/diheme cytochrome c family protein
MRLGLLLVVVACLIASCSGDDGSGASESAADAAAEVVGEELFNERVLGSNPGCITCHSLDEGVTLVGPSLADIASRAAVTVPGLSAADYVRTSITDPDSFVVDGFAVGQMPGGWDETLSDRQIDSLVDFLLGS